MLQRCLQNIMRSWKKHFGLQAATLFVLTSSFVLLISFLTLSQNMYLVLTQWGENAQMTVYIKESAGEKEISSIQKFLNSQNHVGHASYVPREQAAKDFQAQMASYAPDLLSDKDIISILPSSFQVALADDVKIEERPQVLESLAKQFKTDALVEDVTYGQDWVNKYSKFLRSINFIGSCFMGVLMFATLFVMGNSIRNSIAQRREEIEILELIGATAGMIRMPFVFEGAVIGGVSSSLGLIATYFLFQAITTYLAQQIAFVGMSSQIHFVNLFGVMFIIFLGVCLGACGAYICVRSINSGWSASQRMRA